MVKLTTDTGKVWKYIHRLVCEAFHGPPPFPKAKCLHENDLGHDNVPGNLRWGTTAENSEDSHRNGGVLLGSRHPGAKLDEANVITIRDRYRAGEKIKPLAREYGVAQRTMRNVIRRNTWTHI